MRAHDMTRAGLLAVWLGSTAMALPPAALAQEAPLQAGTVGGIAGSPAPRSPLVMADAGPVIVLPEPPPAVVTLAERDDVTGSLGSPPTDDKAAAADPLPPALPFDDQSKSGPAAALDPTTSGAAPTASAPAPAAPSAPPVAAVPSVEVTPAAVSAPSQVAAPPMAPAPPASPPAPPVATGPAQDIGNALATFAAAPAPMPETPAQAAERRKTRDAIVAFYATRANAPLWIADGRLTPAARSVMGRIDHAAEDGLDLRRFPVAAPTGGDPAALTQAELALTEAAVAYGRQASGSRVDVAKLGGIIDLRPEVADAAHILDTLAVAADAGEALAGFNPQQAGYKALRQKLAELRQRAVPEAQGRIPPGPVLKPGMRDARVPLVRARFGLDVAQTDATPALVYDTKVAAAVADFQRAHGLPASGLLTPRTIAALSGGNPTRLDNAIVANMEQWRWLPRELGPDRIEVNIPDYSVRVMRGDTIEHRARVVVGQPDKPTPVFAQQMKFLIVNPYWNVPLSIIRKEMLPKLAADPSYFQNHGYEVIERNGQTYVRQPPGDGNALGRIKFMFPNTHSVYLHDTNARSYFGRDMRALSHGCVRVDQPFSFAEAVLGPDSGWTEAKVKKLIGGKERTINLPKPLPIYIEYFTAFVDPAAGFQLRDDVYGYEAKVRMALGLQD